MLIEVDFDEILDRFVSLQKQKIHEFGYKETILQEIISTLLEVAPNDERRASLLCVLLNNIPENVLLKVLLDYGYGRVRA